MACQPSGGPLDTNGNPEFAGWNFWYVFLYWLSNLQNYVFFVCLYKWWETYKQQEIEFEIT